MANLRSKGVQPPSAGAAAGKIGDYCHQCQRLARFSDPSRPAIPRRNYVDAMLRSDAQFRLGEGADMVGEILPLQRQRQVRLDITSLRPAIETPPLKGNAVEGLLAD